VIRRAVPSPPETSAGLTPSSRCATARAIEKTWPTETEPQKSLPRRIGLAAGNYYAAIASNAAALALVVALRESSVRMDSVNPWIPRPNGRHEADYFRRRGCSPSRPSLSLIVKN
jgi:hypothetical protein